MARLPFLYKRWNEIKLTSLWLSSCEVPLPHQDVLQSKVEVCSWRDSRTIQTDSSGRKQANRTDEITFRIGIRSSCMKQVYPKRKQKDPPRAIVISSLQTRYPTLRHGTSFTAVIHIKILSVWFVGLRRGGILFSQARIQVLCNHFCQTKTQGQRDWELREF